MKMQLISDLHTEFYHGRAMDFLPAIRIEPGLDFLLIPGDLFVVNRQTEEEIQNVIAYVSSKARHVIYTVGNHEYYGSYDGPLATEEKLRAIEKPDNFHWLENEAVVIDGHHFFGGCMWFPFSPMNAFFENMLSDFSQIKDFRYWVYQRNRQFTEQAELLIRREMVVLSHHLPSSLSTPKMYEKSEVNRFFVCDQSGIMMEKQPRLWVHGHTHHGCDYMLDETHVVANPYGYPQERKFFPAYNPVVLEL